MEPFEASRALELHDHLLAGDPTASAEIAEFMLPLVARKLRYRFAHIDDTHLIDEAVHTALLEYFRRPEQYDPDKSNLLTYIGLAAYRDLLNALQSEKRHGIAIPIDEHVADDDPGQEYTIEVADDFELEPPSVPEWVKQLRTQV